MPISSGKWKMPQRSTKFAHMTLLRFLQRGSFSSVYAVQPEKPGQQQLEAQQQASGGPECSGVVAKFETLDIPSALVKEIGLLSRVRSPHVIVTSQLYTCNDDLGASYRYCLLPKYDTDLHDYMTRAGRKFSRALATYIGRQVAVGLQALHAAQIVHGDVKPENVLLLLRKTGPPHVCLADLGSAYDLREVERCGDGHTWNFSSPEVVANTCIGPSSDVFALGCLVAELRLFRPLFAMVDGRHNLHTHVRDVFEFSEKKVTHALVGRVLKPLLAAADAGECKSAPTIDWLLGKELEDDEVRLLRACVAVSPSDRPGLGDLCVAWSTPAQRIQARAHARAHAQSRLP
jgi:serine/threonine protein kinase